METMLAACLPAVGAAALILGAAAVLLGLALRARVGRAARSIAAQVTGLRRHPLVGEIAPDSEPVAGSLAVELNRLLADLRAQVHEAQARSSDLQALADGPSDAALIATDLEWRVVAFSRGASSLTGWPAEELQHHHV